MRCAADSREPARTKCPGERPGVLAPTASTLCYIDFEDRFRNRVHLVDKSPGFIRNEVHRPRPVRFNHDTGTFVDDPDAVGFYEVKTWWRSMDDFVAWTRSAAFAEAHANRAPKEMFRGPSSLDVHEVFLSTDVGDGTARS